jgi:hypothetical protein
MYWTGPEWLSGTYVQGYGPTKGCIIQYRTPKAKLFLVEKLLPIIKLVFDGRGSFRSPPRKPQGDGLMWEEGAWLSRLARSFLGQLWGCGYGKRHPEENTLPRWSLNVLTILWDTV